MPYLLALSVIVIIVLFVKNRNKNNEIKDFELIAETTSKTYIKRKIS